MFTYGLEQRLQCGVCNKVSYRTDAADVLSVPVSAVESGKDADGKTLYTPIPLVACIDAVLAPEALEYGCPSCGRGVHAIKYTRSLLLRRVAHKGSQASQICELPGGACGACEEVPACQLGAY